MILIVSLKVIYMNIYACSLSERNKITFNACRISFKFSSTNEPKNHFDWFDKQVSSFDMHFIYFCIEMT